MSEAWLEGPVDGVSPRLMPVAHSLLDALREVEGIADLDVDRLWARPGGAASVGFHLRHIAGSVDRLLTYARAEGLSEDQLARLRREGEPGDPPATAAELVGEVHEAVSRALDQLRGTPDDLLLEPREVGRRRLPSTVSGLLFHAAEHARRHAGQLLATERVVRSAGEGGVTLPAGALRAALRAWEDAGLSGLCGDGRFDTAVDALRARGIDVRDDEVV